MTTTTTRVPLVLAMVLGSLAATSSAASAADDVRIQAVRVPNGGVQPEVFVERQRDGASAIHLIYLTGDPNASDISYHRVGIGAADTDGGGNERERERALVFGAPIQVNSHPGSALATGTVRGPHLAIGRDRSVHVAWMGSAKAEPRAPGGLAPMLYAKLRAGQDRFGAERNVVNNFVGLDGGGSIAADTRGNVYVAWHAPVLPKADESTRRVYVAHSADNGDSFAPEQPMSDDDIGVCACCSLRLMISSGGGGGGGGGGGSVVGLFRTARDKVHRDAYAFSFRRPLDRTWAGTLDPAESVTCMMSTFAATDFRSRRRFIAAWETKGKIRFGVYSYWSGDEEDDGPRDVLGAAKNCKHPSVAVDRSGNVLVAWAEDTGWGHGGSVAWQLYDSALRPVDDEHARGRVEGLPAWSKPAVLALPGDGTAFAVLY